jgi:hypothetical protein
MNLSAHRKLANDGLNILRIRLTFTFISIFISSHLHLYLIFISTFISSSPLSHLYLHLYLIFTFISSSPLSSSLSLSPSPSPSRLLGGLGLDQRFHTSLFQSPQCPSLPLGKRVFYTVNRLRTVVV